MLFRHQESKAFAKRIRGLFCLHRSSLSRSFRYMYKRILRISSTPHKVALGFSIGIFLACSPFFGVHMILAVFFSWMLRGNFAAAIFGTVFSNPLTFLFIVTVDYKIGYLCLSFFSDVSEISLSQVRALFYGLTFSNVSILFRDAWNSIMMPMILGGTILGFILGSFSYVGVYRAITRFQKKRRQKIMKRRRLLQENWSSIYDRRSW
ncbi:DUF2062 domain-containing protein [Bartonella sp. CB178]|uniref:DUF2062 domain-containing protein n=1 Tax=Bartonella sp. CB178 TaxID=3112255 RepID=UPI00300DDE25